MASNLRALRGSQLRQTCLTTSAPSARNALRARPHLARMIAVAAGKTVSLGIDGMMCGGCTSRVENVLKAVDSVEKVEVSLENKSATIELKEAASVSGEQLATLVKDLGFEVQLKAQ